MDARELAVSAEYLVAIEAGDDWREAIEQFADDEGVTAAWLTGMGTVRDADLWHYDPAADEHRSVRFDEPLSVASCVGTVTGGDEPFARTHAVLSRPSGQALGGYLNAATAVEGAVYLRAMAEPFDLTATAPTDP
ncbi:MAG: PPC domain-containing DNA-binding protein [Haloplanus sp.]